MWDRKRTVATSVNNGHTIVVVDDDDDDDDHTQLVLLEEHESPTLGQLNIDVGIERKLFSRLSKRKNVYL
jgi:hypothetical protein